MPKQTNESIDSRNRSTRRDLEKRSKLLVNILDESSSYDASSQISPRQALESNTRLLQLIEELKELESSINPELPKRCKMKWDEFFNWIDEKNNSKLSEKVDVKVNDPSLDDDNAEYGLIAKVPYKKGDNILTIHRQAMLSSETVKDDPSLYGFILDDPIASTMQNVILVLHLLNEYSKRQKSSWYPYLSILPSRILPVLSMTRDKLELLLASSHIHEALKIIRAISRQYSYFSKRLSTTNLPLAKDFTFVYYCWGVSIVCSRQNEIPAFDRKVCPLPANALIPLLDMCNHDRKSNQATFEENASLLLSSKELAIGDEVTINYGNRSSGEFYIHNGFVPEEIAFDSVPLTVALNKQMPLYSTKVQLLKILNMPTSGKFRLIYNDHKYRHKRDPHLTMFLIVYFLSEDELDHIMDCANPVGLADEIYEYIQYGHDSINNLTQPLGEKEEPVKKVDVDEYIFDILATKKRLLNCVRQYLSKRASISIALIDRVLNDSALNDKDAIMMLKHERSIFVSYIIESS